MHMTDLCCMQLYAQWHSIASSETAIARWLKRCTKSVLNAPIAALFSNWQRSRFCGNHPVFLRQLRHGCDAGELEVEA